MLFFACVNYYICRLKSNLFFTYLALTSVSLFYGINYSVLKIVIPEYLDPFGFVLFRISVAAGIFCLLFLPKREKIDWRADGFRMVLCSATGIAVNQLLFYKGISLTTAINGSIIMTLTPVMVLIWAALINKEKITRFKVLGILLGMIGALIIFYQPAYMATLGNSRGDLLILLNGISYACYLVIVKPLMKKYRPLTVMTWIFLIGIILVMPFTIHQAIAADLSRLTLKVWLSIAYAIVVVTVIVYQLNAWTLTRVKASVVGAFIYLQPLFATLIAILFFNEVLVWKHFIAATFIFSGVWLVTRRSS